MKMENNNDNIMIIGNCIFLFGIGMIFCVVVADVLISLAKLAVENGTLPLSFAGILVGILIIAFGLLSIIGGCLTGGFILNWWREMYDNTDNARDDIDGVIDIDSGSESESSEEEV